MFERPRGVDALAVHIRPVCRSEILDREPPVGAARNACVMAGDLGITPEPSLVLRSVATDQQVDVDAQDLALFLPLGHPYLVADHRPRSLTAIMTGVPSNTPAIGESSSDAQAVTEAERSGRPFLVFRDGDGRQQLFFFDPGAASATVGRRSSADLALAWDDRGLAPARAVRARTAGGLGAGRRRAVEQRHLSSTRSASAADTACPTGTLCDSGAPQ